MRKEVDKKWKKGQFGLRAERGMIDTVYILN